MPQPDPVVHFTHASVNRLRGRRREPQICTQHCDNLIMYRFVSGLEVFVGFSSIALIHVHGASYNYSHRHLNLVLPVNSSDIFPTSS